VGDIEICYVPKFFQEPKNLEDLFKPGKLINLADELVDRWILKGVLAKRLKVDGTETWGEKNKLAVHVQSGIPIDFFSTTEKCWWNYLICRTGGKAMNTRISQVAQDLGWKWHPYQSGFEKTEGTGWHHVTSEEDLFEFLRLEYLPPEKRS
jgi:DNA polymerase/3'-5' exonuclease PolX